MSTAASPPASERPVTTASDELPVVGFATQAEFETWLVANGGMSKGIWLKLAKKNAGSRGLSRRDAVEAALCHGWIDGQTRPLDDAA